MNFYSPYSPPARQWAASSVYPSSHWYTAGSCREGPTPHPHNPHPPHSPVYRPGLHLEQLSRTQLWTCRDRNGCFKDTCTQMFTMYKDTLSHQSGLGVQSAELTSKQSVPIGPWGLDRWRLCLLNNTNLKIKYNNVAIRNNMALNSLNLLQTITQNTLHTLCPWDTNRLTWTNRRCVGMLHVMKLWSRWQVMFSSFAAICSHTCIMNWISVMYLIYFGFIMLMSSLHH